MEKTIVKEDSKSEDTKTLECLMEVMVRLSALESILIKKNVIDEKEWSETIATFLAKAQEQIENNLNKK